MPDPGFFRILIGRESLELLTMVANILLALHILGIALGFTGGIAHAQIVSRINDATEDNARLLWEFERLASRIANVGIGLVIVAGLLMLWLIHGGTSGQGWLFWLKMAFVAVLIGADVVRARSVRAWRGGDATVANRTEMAGNIGGLAAVLAVIAGVFNFN